MYLVQAFHPTIPGMKMSLYVNKPNADARAKELVGIIGDDIVNNFGTPEVSDSWTLAKMNDWEGALAFLKDGMPSPADEEFDVWIDQLDPVDRIPVLGPDDKIELTAASKPYFADYDALVTKNRANMLEAIKRGPGRDHVQPLDPADLVVSTLVRNLANIAAQPYAAYQEGADQADAIDRMVKEAGQAIEAGQAWLDKARPIGKIADDVVRLAGIIVAGTDLHACLSEAMDQHIYDEGDEIEEDCGYTAALKGWTDALAGITVTTYAPPAPAEVPKLLALPLRMEITDASAYLLDANGQHIGFGYCPFEKRHLEWLEFAAKAMNAAGGL